MIAIIADIHSNIHALTAVVHDMRQKNPERILCCGDIVGYGAHPNKCVYLLRKLVDFSRDAVAGNHDAAVTGKLETTNFNQKAQQCVRWTRAEINDSSLAALTALRESAVVEADGARALMVHGSSVNPLTEYIITGSLAGEAFDRMETQLCFCGHTHVPCVWLQNKKGAVAYFQISEDYADRTLVDFKKAIINVGSVGQPRDGNPKACWVEWYPADMRFIFHRVEYDARMAVNAILNANLPDSIAYRLLYGT